MHEDPFDSVLNLEEDLFEVAKRKGINEGKALGRLEGFDLGDKKGQELGAELGYYYGCANLWQAIGEVFPDQVPIK